MDNVVTLDLNTSRTKREVFSDALTALVDAGLEKTNEKPRQYLGASQIGDECLRRVQYEILHPEKGEPLSGKTRRIFARGHMMESMAATWLDAAGFNLSVIGPQNYQHGFIAAGGKLRGHIDGILLGGPAILEYPTIWENKALGAKGWKSVAKDGVAKAYPKYADQIALYQAYMKNTNPALFTAVNADTMEVWAEVVPFDQKRAQDASDRAVKILQANAAGELLPRATSSSETFPCPWCRFKKHCWGET